MQRGCSSAADGVVIDWCAPPSGASVTPDGVPTRIDCPPAYMPKDHGSSARLRNGSYIVPMGSNGSPSRDHVAPSSESRPTRLPSAIPSSMCWPWADSRQRMSVSVSSANQSMRSPGFQTPARLIHPPRFVEEATSGETVTTRAAASGAAWARSTKKRPKACWVEADPRCSRPTDAGSAGGSRSTTSGRSSSCAAAAHSAPSALPSGKGAQGSAASAPSSPARCSHSGTLSSAEWLAGWPCVGRPHALMV